MRYRLAFATAAVLAITAPAVMAGAGSPQGLRVARVGMVSGPVSLPAGCQPVADDNTAQVAVDPTHPSHIVAAYTVGVAAVEVMAVSTDGGRTWDRQLAGDLTDCGSRGSQGLDPDLVVGAGGTTWLTQGFLSSTPTAVEHDAVREYVSGFAPGAAPSDPTDIDTGAALQRGWILADPSAPGTAYVETERADYVGTYLPGWPVDSVTVRKTTDGGQTWAQTGSVTGATPGHGMLAGALERSGDAMVAIVHDVFLPTAVPTVVQSGGAQASGNAVAYRSTDDGATWTAAGILGAESACCLLDSAAAPDGTLYAVWAEPTGGAADLALSRSTDGGRTWTESRPAHDVGDAGVQVAVGADGGVCLFWYSTDGSHLTPVATVSHDQGRTWPTPVTLAAPFDPDGIATTNDTGPLGPYQDLAAMPHGYVAAFTVGGSNVTAGGTSDVMLAVLTDRR